MFEAGGEGFAGPRDQSPLIKSRACVGGRGRVTAGRGERAVGGIEGVEKRSRELRIDREYRSVRRGCSCRNTRAADIGSSSPLTASMASRISSASRRRTVRFQSKRYSGSTRWPAASSRFAAGAMPGDRPPRSGSADGSASSASLGDELRRQPVEQLGMAGRFAQAAEVARRARQSSAEMVLPDPIDDDRVESGLSGRLSQRARASRRPVDFGAGRRRFDRSRSRDRDERKPGSIASACGRPG